MSESEVVSGYPHTWGSAAGTKLKALQWEQIVPGCVSLSATLRHNLNFSMIFCIISEYESSALNYYC